MDQEYEKLVNWFVTLLEESRGKPPGEWLNDVRDSAINNSCECALCEATHIAIHMLLDGDRDGLLNGEPVIKAAFLLLLDNFIRSTHPPTDKAVAAALAYRSEAARILDSSGIKIPDQPIPKTGPNVRVVTPDRDGVAALLKEISAHKPNKEFKSLPFIAGKNNSAGNEPNAQIVGVDTRNIKTETMPI